MSDCSTEGCVCVAMFGARPLDARPPTGDRLVCGTCLMDRVLMAPRSDTPEPSWIVWRLAEELLTKRNLPQHHDE